MGIVDSKNKVSDQLALISTHLCMFSHQLSATQPVLAFIGLSSGSVLCQWLRWWNCTLNAACCMPGFCLATDQMV